MIAFGIFDFIQLHVNKFLVRLHGEYNILVKGELHPRYNLGLNERPYHQ